MRDTRPTFVYRCYDVDSRLLYVGCSVDPAFRIEGHRKSSWWADRLAYYETEEHPNRDAALDAERRAIYSERPACNVKSRWYQGDPRENWSLIDYANYRAAVVASARGFHGPQTTSLLAAIDGEARELLERAA